MSYQKHNFQAGDVLFASQLNEMDNQIEISSRVTQIEPASNLPLMDNVATVGASNKYAREDHVHPKDITKLDTPIGGTVGQFIKKTSTGTEWSDVPVKSVNGQTGDVTVQAATDAQVSTAVNTWCGNNIAQETGYVLDSSLTMSNAAAPADKVGELKSAIDNMSGFLSDTAIQLLETILSAAVYTSDQSANIDTLIEELSSGGNVDNITVADGVMTILGLANTPTASGGILTII